MGKMLKVFLIISLVLGITGCSSNQPSSDQKPAVKVMKIGSVVQKERSTGLGLEKFAEIVNKESKGTIKVEVYHNGVLGDDRRTLEGLNMGTIQGTQVSTGNISAFVPQIAAFDLPFLFKDKATAYKVLDGPIGQEILQELPKAGFIGLSYWENGFRHITNNKKEIKTLEDLQGLKIRTTETKMHVDLFKEFGANPTPLSYNQLYSALEQKVVDGQENPIGNVKTAKFYEVQKYLTLDGHVYNAAVFLISKVFWDTLTDSEKDLMKRAAEEAKTYQRQMNEKEDTDYVDFLKKQGMTITELTPEEKARWRKAAQPIYEQYKQELGVDLMNKLLEATK